MVAMTKWKFAICILGLGICSCSKGPRAVRITDRNKDTFMDEIKDMKGLTVDETRLLIAYQIRGAMSKVAGGKDQDPEGKR
jgi:hypothetical protein